MLKNLFTPYERRRGLPTGNLTNQLFSKFARPASAQRLGAALSQKASDSESPRRSRDSRGEMVRRRGAPPVR